MPTHLSQFREIVIDVLNDHAPDSVDIEDLYDRAQKNLIFDEHDLANTILKENSTNEPNWKRNLRNALQGMKDRNEVVNSQIGYWRLPSPNNHTFLEPAEAWVLIANAANKAKIDHSTWTSTKQGHTYEVTEVEDNKIFIRRDSADSIEKLYKADVLRALKSLNAAGGILGRRCMHYTVAKEVSIVHFHPSLKWDEDFEFIHVIPMASNPVKLLVTKFQEAQNDDINQYQNYARRIRKGQDLLRRNLLTAYDHKCCISGTGPDNVLQAAHIDSHAETGNNNSVNGLLLRSDLHDLFDDGLLLIEPSTFLVRLHPCLMGTDYYQYEGKPLIERIDGLKPDGDCLTRQWDKRNWMD